MLLAASPSAPSAWQGEIPSLRVFAFLVNAFLAILLLPGVAWLTVYLLAGTGEPQQVLVRSGLLFIALLLVATSLSNALFLLRPPSVVRDARSVINVLNIVSLAILLALAAPVWLTQVDAELIESVMSSARRARRVMRVAVLTFSPIIIIALGYTQVCRRIRVAG
jgi:hypothetical protein